MSLKEGHYARAQTSLSTEKEAETKASTSEVSEESPVQTKNPPIVNSTVKSEVSEESEVSEVSLGAVRKPTIQEIFQALRPKLHTCFSEEKLLKHIIELGFTREQAERRIIVLADQGIIAMDNIGNWCWVKGN